MIAPLPWTLPGRLSGIDVSSAQSRLPWAAIAADGIRFASVKASEATFDDARFAAHLAGARSVGLHTGSYHYLHSSEDGARQAEHYARQIGSDGELTERPTLDWEDGWRVARVGPRVALDSAIAFLRRIRSLTGRRPTVYTGPSFVALFRGLDLSELADHDLWIAHYRWDPATGHDYGLEAPTIPAPWSRAVAWQAGGNGAPRVPGCPVDLDRDVFFGDESAYLAWCKDAPTREPGIQLGDDGPPPRDADRAAWDASEHGTEATAEPDYTP